MLDTDFLPIEKVKNVWYKGAYLRGVSIFINIIKTYDEMKVLEQKNFENVDNHCFTFIMDYGGGTYISQVMAEDVKIACRIWAETIETKPIQHFGNKMKKKLLKEVTNEEFPPQPLDNLINVWCVTANLKGFVLINIVKTDITPFSPSHP